MKFNKWVRYLITLALSLSVPSSEIGLCDQSPTESECSSLLPAEVRAALDIGYKGWRVLEYRDLASDIQDFWDKNHQKECPGVAIGRFDGKHTAYAFIIIEEVDGTKQVKLMISEKRKDKHTLRVLYNCKEINIIRYPVVLRSPPGIYKDIYNNKNSVTARNEVILFEYHGARAIIFYYLGGRYHQMLIWD
jgi:hypothetical protein